jgi:hypothetical protein
MKKILLSAMALVAAMSVNAQEICTFNADNALGLDSDNGTALSAGTVIGETASIVASVGADDTYKPQSVKAVAGDTEINGGLQGSTNPKDEDGASSNTTLKVPVSGAYLQFEAKADGFLYVIHKASSNKAYTVFEEGEAIGYTFAAIGNKDPLPEVYEFTLAGAGEYNWLKEAGITSVEFAEQEYLKAVNMNERKTKAREGLAYVYAVEGKFDQACKTYTELYEDTGNEIYKPAITDTETQLVGEMNRR